jgi:hypothetical protein
MPGRRCRVLEGYFFNDCKRLESKTGNRPDAKKKLMNNINAGENKIVKGNLPSECRS